MLTIGSCFSGIGGLELGLEKTGGFKTLWQIENDAYASAVLAKHWPDAKRFSDIRDVVRPPDVDVICGGFPCQDVSLAGARAGLGGKRSTLWGEMYRLICEVKPRWVVAENVPGLLSSDGGRFFGNILRDMAAAGYDAEWGVLSAAGVGAPHLRERIFIVAYTNGFGLSRGANKGSRRTVWTGRKEQPSRLVSPTHWMDISEGKIRRMDDGLPRNVDRLKCLGNAVVPQVAQKVGEIILRYDALRLS